MALSIKTMEMAAHWVIELQSIYLFLDRILTQDWWFPVDREWNMKKRKRERREQEGGEASEKTPRGDENSSGT